MTVAKHYSSSPSAKEPSWFLVVLLSGIISGVLLFTIGWYLSLPTAEKDAVFKNILSAGDIFPGIPGLTRPKVLLVMGVDMPPKGSGQDDYKYVRTDTMMLVKLDTFHKKVNIVSIPRDSRVFIPGTQRSDKINAAFTYGGPDLAVATVEQTFGVEVDNYVVVNVRGVRDFVDALGGIDLYVEKPMHYRDRTAGLNINLETGQQHLDGEQAEGFLRFRHDALGDIGRIRRQQQFIAAVTTKLKDPRTLLGIKPMLTASNNHILTDLATPELISLVLFGKELKRSSFQVATLPGHPSSSSYVSYWIIDKEPAEEVLNRLIIGLEDEIDPAAIEAGPTVGILYTSSHAEGIEAYQTQLEADGFKVVCKLKLNRTASRVIIHNNRQLKEIEQKIQRSNKAFKNAQLIFSPPGGTFETNSCGRSDFTVVLGEDTRSAVN